jgi:hypothetical protein
VQYQAREYLKTNEDAAVFVDKMQKATSAYTKGNKPDSFIAQSEIL